MARWQNWLQQALSHHQAGKLRAAEALYRKVLWHHPGHANALCLLGTLYFQRGQYEVATHTLQRAVSLAPNDAGAHHNLGSALQKQGHLAAAVTSYERALALKPDYAEAHHNLGVTFQTKGHLEAAATHFAEAVALDPASPQAHYHLGIVQQTLGHLKAAAASYEQVVALQPDFIEAHNNLGNVLKGQNCLDEAMASFERALACQPDYAEAHYNLAQTFTRLGKLESAVTSYEQALTLKPDFAEAHYGLGHALLLQDEPAPAAEQFRQTLALQPTHDEARFFLAAVSNTAAPETVPPQVVVSMFDRYAEWFDNHLRDTLGYRIPEILRHTVEKVAHDEPAAWTILDLGCGTGLCGLLFRDLATKLIGVDLSPRMLTKAAERGVYDDLRSDDLTTVLRSMSGECDLVLAADVFIYVGNLASVFAACYTALREGGRFAFSIEAADADGFVLRPSGRFAHTPAYITVLAQRHGFTIEYEDSVMVRMEKGQPLTGHVFILRREAAAWCKGASKP